MKTLSTILITAAAVAALAGAAFATPPPPANDNYASAQTIDNRAGGVTGTTIGATKESGEPTYGDNTSVWYRWTAPASGGATFNTAGSNFANCLVVRKVGSGFGALERYDSSDSTYMAS